jgi:hypothetical protein
MANIGAYLDEEVSMTIRQFATDSPKGASATIYLAGYLIGSLFGASLSYLISGAVKTGAVLALGAGCGPIALGLAQHWGIVPKAEELNRPITLFGSTRR